MWGFIEMLQRGHDQLVSILLVGDGDMSMSQHNRPSGSNWSGVCVLVGSVPELTVNFSRLKGVSRLYRSFTTRGRQSEHQKLIVN